MDGDYSSSFAAGNSHSCCGDDVFFRYSVIRQVGLLPVSLLGFPR